MRFLAKLKSAIVPLLIPWPDPGVDSEDVGDEADRETGGDTEETKDSGRDTEDNSIRLQQLSLTSWPS